MTNPFHNMKVSENITTPGNEIQRLSQVCFKMFTEDNIYFYGKAESLFQRLGKF